MVGGGGIARRGGGGARDTLGESTSFDVGVIVAELEAVDEAFRFRLSVGDDGPASSGNGPRVRAGPMATEGELIEALDALGGLSESPIRLGPRPRAFGAFSESELPVRARGRTSRPRSLPPTYAAAALVTPMIELLGLRLPRGLPPFTGALEPDRERSPPGVRT
jgi:hypothetical protein